MFQSNALRRSIALAAGLTALATASAPAFAKATTVTLPASAVKDETSRICMPRTILGKNADKTLPQTICQTRDVWTTQGVTIVLK